MKWKWITVNIKIISNKRYRTKIIIFAKLCFCVIICLAVLDMKQYKGRFTFQNETRDDASYFALGGTDVVHETGCRVGSSQHIFSDFTH